MNQPKFRVPRLAGRFVNVYKPQGDVYTLPTVTSPHEGLTYEQGQFYAEWRTNDHTFIKGPDERWHCFGITKPWTSGDNGHSGEGLCFHAVAPRGSFGAAMQFQAWQDLPKIAVGDCGWAPAAVKIGDEYSLIGSNLGRAASRDLLTWRDCGRLPVQGGHRDPYLFFGQGLWHLLRCDGNRINCVTSPDFATWSAPVTVYQPEKASYQTESPVLVVHEGLFYLFWTLWDTADESTGGFCPRTYVFGSTSPLDFGGAPLAEITAHAPEVLQDENGQWFLSSADYPCRGVSVAPLVWE